MEDKIDQERLLQEIENTSVPTSFTTSPPLDDTPSNLQASGMNENEDGSNYTHLHQAHVTPNLSANEFQAPLPILSSSGLSEEPEIANNGGTNASSGNSTNIPKDQPNISATSQQEESPRMAMMSSQQFQEAMEDQPVLTSQQLPSVDLYPTEKTFKFANDCALSIGNTPSGFSTLIIYIKDTPYFAVGTLFSTTALELTSAEIYYNSKKDFLLDEDIDPNSESPIDLDKDRRLHKLSIYKTEENEYRLDLCKLAKTGVPELDAQDPWKDFNDLTNTKAGEKQIEMVKKFLDVLKVSRNEPDMIILGKVPENYPPLQPTVGVVMFKRV